MARHRGPVLVDTNVILESHRIGAWAALAGGYTVETVEDCVTETQTGFQRRRPEQQIDAKELRASLAAVHVVEDRELAAVAISAPDIALDLGERSLWAHALTRVDGWILCGQIRRVCVSASEPAIASDLSRWSGSSTRRATGQRNP